MGISPSKKETVIDQRFTVPSGLYSCKWDIKLVRKLVLAKKLAPLYPGKEEVTEGGDDLEECPICFLYYPGGLNRANCCKKGICTECFLQIKLPGSRNAVCPFCNYVGYCITFSGPLPKIEKEKELQEEQKVIELQLKIRQEEIEREKEKEDKRRSQMILEGSLNPSKLQIKALQFEPSISHPLQFPFGDLENSSEEEELHPQSVPSNSALRPPQNWFSTSFPPHSSFNTKTVSESDAPEIPEMVQDDDELDKMMLLEAIRLSLTTTTTEFERPSEDPTSPPVNTTTATSNTSSEDESSSTDMEKPELEINDSHVEIETDALDYELAVALSMSMNDDE